MNETLSMQIQKLYGMYVASKKEQERVFALPNGGYTSDRAEARREWEMYQLFRNVRKTNNAKKLGYCKWQ